MNEKRWLLIDDEIEDVIMLNVLWIYGTDGRTDGSLDGSVPSGKKVSFAFHASVGNLSRGFPAE
jgi:hypothetical protein